MKRVLTIIILLAIQGCASLTSDAMTPIALSFSDGSNGTCILRNKRGIWHPIIPSVPYVRRSDDSLKYQCVTDDGRNAFGSIASRVGAKLFASVLFLDLGITDAITDKHREYSDSYVIPVPAVSK